MAKVLKVRDLEGKKIIGKEEGENLRGNIIILNPEKSEIAKHLNVGEKGAYAMKA